MDLPEHHQYQQCQSRKRPSVLALLREQMSVDCLPMEMCPSHRELAAVAKAAVARVMGLGEVVPAAGQGRDAVAQERDVGSVASVVVPQPAL